MTATYPGDSELQASAQATAPTGLTVTKDTSTVTVSETPTSVVYGNESASVFTVGVVTGNHEVLPATDSVTVNVGTTFCVASVAPAGPAAREPARFANAALPVSGSAYAVTATYSGDTDLSASTTATAPTGLTVTKDTTSVVGLGEPDLGHVRQRGRFGLHGERQPREQRKPARRRERDRERRQRLVRGARPGQHRRHLLDRQYGPAGERHRLRDHGDLPRVTPTSRPRPWPPPRRV